MKWRKASLGTVAPPVRSSRQFRPDEEVWQLNLDQIESQTGRILSKQRDRVSAAGNSTFVFDEGNVLYSKLRPYLNKVVHPDEPGIATSELVPLRPRTGVLRPGFLKFYLRSDRFLIFANQVVAGAKMPRMIMDKFWEHEIPLPAPREQNRIVEILEQADALRQKRSEADALADRILPALFHTLFGDPATNPKNFHHAKLGSVITETAYGTSVSSNTDGQGVPVLRMNNITSNGRLRLEDLKYVSLEKDELRRHLLEAGDLLFNRTNSRELVGKTGLWRGEMQAVAASYLIRVEVDRGQVKPEFVWAWLNTQFIKQQLFDMARRAIGMANINATELRSLPVLVPPLSLQETFVKCLEQIHSDTLRRSTSRETIESLFKSMLHRAFAGELTAKWREAHLKELLTELEQQAEALEGDS